jgi:signal peptidase II
VQERRAVVAALTGRQRAPAGATAARKGRRPALAAVVAAAVLAADQVTKVWARDHLSILGPGRHLVGPLWLRLTYNSGAAFGIGKGVTPVVEAVVAVLVIALLVLGRRASRRASRTEAVAIGLLAGGAVGNLADRFLLSVPGHPGSVVDFIDALQFGRHEYWPVFNLADAAIVVGAVLLAVRLSGAGGRGGAPPSP